MLYQIVSSPTTTSKLRGSLAWIVLTLTVICCVPVMKAQEQPWSLRMTNTTLQRWPHGHYRVSEPVLRWNYQLSVLLEGMEAEWMRTGDKAVFGYIRETMDQLVQQDGSIPTYQPSAQSMDDILLGRQLLLLYRVTHENKYLKAAHLIRAQLVTQPRNTSGGYWHSGNFPDQMLLDDEYMLAPFLAEYAKTFNEPQDFTDITKQFVLLEDHTRDSASGLLYQEWNEPRTEMWVNKTTGTSASFWGRGTGWYIMALVDALPYYPLHSSDRSRLLAILNRTAEAIVRYQDKESGLWYEVMDKPQEKGNYQESSAAGMFVYALAKGVRLGFLPKEYSVNAQRGWQGMLDHFVQIGPGDTVTITGTVKGIDLGSAPSHDGSFAYYISAPVISNDPKGVGAFLLASTEMETAGGKEK